MKAASSLQTRWGLSRDRSPPLTCLPSRVRGSNAYMEAQLAGEGAAGGERGREDLAFSASQTAREQRQSKKHRAGNLFIEGPF